MRTVFLVPRRKDNGHRDKLWAYARARWERYFPDIPVVEGHHDEGSFNRSAAINAAARKAGDWDLGIVIDSDVMLSVSQARAAIDRAAETGKVTWGHRRWRGFAEDWTNRWVRERRDLGAELDRDTMDLYVERTNPLSWSCFIVLPRPVFDDLGGFDERFRGWGFEDMAFQSIIVGLYGYERIDGDIIHLWHPRSDERIILGQSRTTASDDYIRNGLLGRRYMYALRRDHAGHDRANEASEVERERDMRNIVRDDRKFLDVAAQRKMPEASWADWWPTLPELRESAKTGEMGPEPTVALILRTGGEAETWPARSAYLRQSIASLSKQVTGPISQRVIYADWDPRFRPELDAIAREHGFYVVGPSQHVGFPGCVQEFWRYIDRRTTAPYIFSVEDDFVYREPVDLGPMIATLRANPELRQLALLRDAYYPRELEAGGVLPTLKVPAELVNHRPHPFLRQRDHFTLNPSLFHRSLVQTPWPAGESSERRFGDAVLKDKRAAFAYWGSGEPAIEHIGATRAASAY
jgi:hypothetical protein